MNVKILMEPEETHAVARAEDFIIPKRRVAVEVQLSDGETLIGQFYHDVQRADGTPGSLIDRLLDTREQYIPLATDNRHVLLNKSRIVTVQLRDHESQRAPRAAGARSLSVQIRLSTGSTVEGSIYALLPAARSRTLDYLNGSAGSFFPLHGERIVLINNRHVMRVSETIRHERLDV